jgi:hypothetical protein
VKRFRPRLTYANVMATIAVFIALGGASYAATKLPKNSVGTKQLKANAVTTAKIKNGAVTGAKINTASLGTVPSAAQATNAAQATSAINAQNAAALGSVPASRYVTPTSTLQSGQTETGVFGASGDLGSLTVAVFNFIPKLPAAVDASHAIYLPIGASDPNCPGVGKANPGFLCVYAGGEVTISFIGFYAPDSTGGPGTTADGATLYFSPSANGSHVRGTWAYQAP